MREGREVKPGGRTLCLAQPYTGPPTGGPGAPEGCKWGRGSSWSQPSPILCIFGQETGPRLFGGQVEVKWQLLEQTTLERVLAGLFHSTLIMLVRTSW